jgi:hypothetical protein
MKNKNQIDKYLEIENILPHQKSLARGYQKGSNYDTVVLGYLSKNVYTKR